LASPGISRITCQWSAKAQTNLLFQSRLSRLTKINSDMSEAKGKKGQATQEAKHSYLLDLCIVLLSYAGGGIFALLLFKTTLFC
jgi:hypothetical protein